MISGYVIPSSIEECVEYLEKYQNSARIIAGGTDLVLQQKEKKLSPLYWVDISRIQDLDYIEEKNGKVCLGAGVTHAQVAASSLIKEKAALLAKASESVGSPQIRNVATVVGNVVNAQPAADAAIALIALEAEADVVSTKGKKKTVPVKELYAGLGKSRIDSTCELVTGIHFPALGPKQGSSFKRISPRNSLSLPVLNVGMVLGVEKGIIEEIRIVLGPVADRPFRPKKAEGILQGSSLDNQENIGSAISAASEECTPRDSLIRGSSAYRRELVRVMVKRAYQEAVNHIRS